MVKTEISATFSKRGAQTPIRNETNQPAVRKSRGMRIGANGAAESCGRYVVEWRGVRAGGCAGLERGAQTDFDDHAVCGG